tara:strand:+ start:1444 stop:2505 length:1062 start_codon:yes stop_codon:yes gene_type:complete
MEKGAKQIFNLMKKEGCRQITFHYDPKTDLNLVWVVDSIPDKRDKSGKLSLDVSTSGGTRFAHKDPDVALEDALKLARAMTRKAKVLGIKEGGSKAVALANQEKDVNFLHSIGDFIQIHKGLFKTAIDLGFVLDDGKKIASNSDYVDSLSHLEKGLGSTGENTAEGIIHGYKVICKEILNKSLKDCSVAIQGLGAVGMPLAERLVKIGSKVIASDIVKENCERAKKLGIKIVPPSKIINSEVDIFAPCALGAVVNNKTISKLKCKIVAGGANNPLQDEFKDEKSLLKRGIVYVPDFILNCGGFLQALVERDGGTIEKARKESIIVSKRVKQIFDYSKKHNLTLLESATKLFDR